MPGGAGVMLCTLMLQKSLVGLEEMFAVSGNATGPGVCVPCGTASPTQKPLGAGVKPIRRVSAQG